MGVGAGREWGQGCSEHRPSRGPGDIPGREQQEEEPLWELQRGHLKGSITGTTHQEDHGASLKGSSEGGLGRLPTVITKLPCKGLQRGRWRGRAEHSRDKLLPWGFDPSWQL
jgi:hypothetical protein